MIQAPHLSDHKIKRASMTSATLIEAGQKRLFQKLLVKRKRRIYGDRKPLSGKISDGSIARVD
jgi:hypothetical protein